MSRSFGDQLSKIWTNQVSPENIQETQIHDVVTSEPEIFEHEYKENMDFVFIASDGIYDVLSNKQIIEIIWGTFEYHRGKGLTADQILEDAVQNVLKKALLKDTDDNITAILVCFRNMFV